MKLPSLSIFPLICSSNRFGKFHIPVIKIKLYFTIFMTSTIKYKTFMRIGYVRVSKEEQNEALQMDALKN